MDLSSNESNDRKTSVWVVQARMVGSHINTTPEIIGIYDDFYDAQGAIKIYNDIRMKKFGGKKITWKYVLVAYGWHIEYTIKQYKTNDFNFTRLKYKVGEVVDYL